MRLLSASIFVPIFAVTAASLPAARAGIKFSEAAAPGHIYVHNGPALWRITSDSVAFTSRLAILIAGARRGTPEEMVEPLAEGGFGRARFRNIVPKIDAEYYGNGGELEVDFVVRPGGDPTAIRLIVTGGAIDCHGDIVAPGPSGILVQKAPFVYQTRNGARVFVRSTYRRLSAGEFGFDVGDYDPQLPLIVDPVISFKSTLGGSGDGISATARDAAGNLYVTGGRGPTGLSTTPGAWQTDPTTSSSYLMSLAPAGDVLRYSTYLPFNANALAVDSHGNAYMTTNSCVVKVNSTGTAQVYKKCFTGLRFTAIAVDGAGNAIVSGPVPVDPSVPISPGAVQSKLLSPTQSFVIKLDPSGTNVVYATYFGGSGDANITAIAADGAGNAYLTGSTRWSPDFPLANAFQSHQGGGPIVKSTDGGLTWFPVSKDLPGSNAQFMNAVPNNPGIFYAGFKLSNGGTQLYKSLDFGANWNVAGTVPAQCCGGPPVLVPDPLDPSVLYYYSSQGNYFVRSADGGKTWSPLTGPGSCSPYGMLVDPIRNSTIYGHEGCGDGRMYRSDDAGKTWQPLTINGAALFGVVPRYGANSGLYAVQTSGVFKSTDFGQTWTLLGKSPVGGSLLFSPNNPSAIYLAGSSLAVSLDDGQTWTSAPNSNNYNVDLVDTNDPNLFYGRGFGDGFISMRVSNNALTALLSVSVPGLHLVASSGSPSVIYGIADTGYDAFVAELDPTGTQLIFSTFFGGAGSDVGQAIAVDPSGAVYIGGATNSRDLPVTSSAAQQVYAGTGTDDWSRITGAGSYIGPITYGPSADTFVAKFDPSGGSLLYCTYLGGSKQDDIRALAVDAAGNIFLAGVTSSRDFPFSPDSPPFPTPTALQLSVTGSFVTELGANGGAPIWSEYVDGALWGITTDESGGAAVVGTSSSTTAPADALSGDIVVTVFQQPDASPPRVFPGGIVDVFDFQRSRGAPGSLASIYGSGLSTSSAAALSIPLPTALGGASVEVDGVAAPLFYASPGQINFQIPWETSPGISQVAVTVAGQTSRSAPMQVNTAAPNLLVDPDTNRVIAVNQDGTLNNPDNPASPDSVILVFLTGQGPVDGPPPDGAATAGAAAAKLPFSATLGRSPASVLYLGLAPTFVGLGQANIRIPQLAAADYPLVLTVNGVSSNWSTVSVGSK